MSANINFGWNRPIKDIIRETTGGDKTALFAASQWQKLIDPWVPMRTGHLAHDQVRIYTTYSGSVTVGIIEYYAPYAARLYYNDFLNFSKEKHPYASAFFDRAAKNAGKGADLLKSVERFIKNGGK